MMMVIDARGNASSGILSQVLIQDVSHDHGIHTEASSASWVVVAFPLGPGHPSRYPNKS